jgi:hypothetical protein
MNDVSILDKKIVLENNKNNIHSSFLVVLKQVAQYTDQMGSGMSDVQNIIRMMTNVRQSDIQTIVMSHIQMSRRTAVQLCLITGKLISLTMNDVSILDKKIVLENNKNNIHSSFLVVLKQVAQYTDQFKWIHLKSLTLGISKKKLL